MALPIPPACDDRPTLTSTWPVPSGHRSPPSPATDRAVRDILVASTAFTDTLAQAANTVRDTDPALSFRLVRLANAVSRLILDDIQSWPS